MVCEATEKAADTERLPSFTLAFTYPTMNLSTPTTYDIARRETPSAGPVPG